MNDSLSQQIYNINTLIDLLGKKYDYGHFRFDEPSGLVVQEKEEFLKETPTILGRYPPKEATAVFSNITSGLFEIILSQVEVCNQSISSAFLKCKYGTFEFDTSSQTINHQFQGIKCSYDLMDGIRKLSKTQYKLDTERTIHETTEKIFFGVIEAETKESYVTEFYDFVCYEDFDTRIRCTCKKPGNWTRFVLEVFLSDAFGQWHKLRELHNVLNSFSNIQLKIGLLLKEMRKKEHPSILGNLFSKEDSEK